MGECTNMRQLGNITVKAVKHIFVHNLTISSINGNLMAVQHSIIKF